MFGCRRLDEDLNFLGLKSVSHSWQIPPENNFFFLFFLVNEWFVFSEVIIHMVIPALYRHAMWLKLMFNNCSHYHVNHLSF